MSLRPLPWPEPAEEITKAVLAMYAGRRAPLPVVVRDELDEVFADAEFAQAFADRGTPGWSRGLALITVLQMVDNLTDRQAVEAVRDKISWKYALGLALTDPGFDFSVLSEFRGRVVEHGLEAKVLDLLVGALVEKGLLKAGGKQRTDSTRVLAAVRDLNRLLARGVPARVVMEVLGHSQIGVTMNIYSHVMPTQLTQAADAMESALWGQDRWVWLLGCQLLDHKTR